MSGLFSTQLDQFLGRKPQQHQLLQSLNSAPPTPANGGLWGSIADGWDAISGTPQASDGTGGSGLQGLGFSENGASAARMAGAMGLGMGALTALNGEGFMPGAAMGALGGGFGSYLQNREDDSGDLTGTKGKKSPSQKLLSTGANMISQSNKDSEAEYLRMLNSVEKAPAIKPRWTGSALPTNQAVGVIPTYRR